MKENTMNNSLKSEEPIAPVGKEEWEAAKDYMDCLEHYIRAHAVVNYAFGMRKDGKPFVEIMEFINSLK